MGVVVITGADTGVGKTTLAALLVCHLRQRGRRVVALKPFCSGGREDAQLLLSLQDKGLALDDVNPFHFPEPLAPLVAARIHRRAIPLRAVLDHVNRIWAGATARTTPAGQPILLLEGAGGLLAPLGEGYDALELIKALQKGEHVGPKAGWVGPLSRPKQALKVIVVARNQLGTINHIRLTVQALHNAGVSDVAITVVLMSLQSPDASAASNARLLREFLAPVPSFVLPFLGSKLGSADFTPLVRRHRRLLEGVAGR